MAAFTVILEVTDIISTTLMKYLSKKCTSVGRKELSSKRITGVVGTGSMSDPYNVYEKKLMLTREALRLLNKYNKENVIKLE